MIQIATPSRERVEHYVRLRADVEQAVGRINGDYSSVGHPVLHYLHQSLPREELVAFFVAADVMLVTPLRDGMNLVAKEYVASRGDLGGALVLSEFTGAAIELKDALLVNPHDIDGLKNAITAAFDMPAAERTQADADAAPPGPHPRRRPLGPFVPRRAGPARVIDLAGLAAAPRAAGRARLRRHARPDRRGAVGRPRAARGARPRSVGWPRCRGRPSRWCPGVRWPISPPYPGSGRRCGSSAATASNPTTAPCPSTTTSARGWPG